MRLISLFLFLLCVIVMNAQDCDVVADENYVSFLQKDIQAEIQALNSPSKKEPRIFMVSFHRVRNTNGGLGIKASFVNSAFNKLNEAYIESNIQFELCDDMADIDNSKFTSLTYQERFELINTYNVPNTINIYFIPNVLNSSGDGICGNATFPSTEASQRRILMDNDCVTNGSTFIHEMGHYFNVLHTHSSFFGEERVDRINCDNLGDGLCDTPADPRLSGDIVSNCTYIGNEEDSFGVPYMPDVTNFMSYAPKSCRVSFTEEQRAVISLAASSSNDYHLTTCSLPDFSIKFNGSGIDIEDFVDKEVELELKSDIIYQERIVKYTAFLSTGNINDNLILSEGELTFDPDNRINQISLSIPFSNSLYKVDNLKIEIDYDDEIQEINEQNNSLEIAIRHGYQSKGSLVLYPNPTNNDLNLFLNNNYQGDFEYRIFDLSGKIFQSGNFVKLSRIGFKSFNVRDLIPGAYIINLQYGAESETIKFLKF